MDLNLLFTNATVADDAIRFVAEHDRSKHKSKAFLFSEAERTVNSIIQTPSQSINLVK
jgi:hypothetical protein